MRLPLLNAAGLTFAAALLAGCAATSQTPSTDTAQTDVRPPSLSVQNSGTRVLLVAADAVDDETAWVSGAGGTVLRTLDGGFTWQDVSIPGTDTLQFRDVEAFGPDTAYVLSIGNGASSRIFKTTDGGQSWDLQFTNREPRAFFDCLAFWDETSGIGFSDAVGGSFPVVATTDGAAWRPTATLPDAREGEGSFAASGTCIVTLGESGAVFGTGASGQTPQAVRTADRGATWTSSTIPIVGAGEAAGVASLAFLDDRYGFAAGGDLAEPDTAKVRLAKTTDGGATWTAAGAALPLPVVYGLAVLPGSSPGAARLLATGPAGVAFSPDDGATWTLLADEATWGLSFTGSGDDGTGWVVGPQGRIARVTLR